MPLRSLVRAFEPVAPAQVRAAGEGLTYRDFVLVALVLDAEQLFPDNWIYVHTPGLRVGRVQNFNNWSAAMVPEPGRTCLGLEYFCSKGDSVWEQPDHELIALASRELDQLGAGSRRAGDRRHRGANAKGLSDLRCRLSAQS
jgi:protoporphyrinogen oxidase